MQSSPKRAVRRRYVGWLKAIPFLAILGAVVWLRLVATVPVRSHVVDQGVVTREMFGRATIESRREVQLGFDLVGRLTDVLVDEGDRVKLGQVVAHLAPEQLNADVRAASSGVPLARAAIARLAADERRAQATLLFAQQEATRLRALAASGSVSPRDLDLAEQQLSLAQADLERVHATQAEAQKEVAVASSATDSKTATVMRAVLVSPFDGVVIRRFKDPGDTVVVGTTVLRVVAVDRLWARAAVDESMLGDVREGLSAEVALLGETGEPLRGTVDRVGREVDRQTHEVLVDVLLVKAPTQLAIGHRADVHIELERRGNVLRMPLVFLRRDGDRTFVFVDRGGKIDRADVKVGLAGRELVEIISGLARGDVVLDPEARAECSLSVDAGQPGHEPCRTRHLASQGPLPRYQRGRRLALHRGARDGRNLPGPGRRWHGPPRSHAGGPVGRSARDAWTLRRPLEARSIGRGSRCGGPGRHLRAGLHDPGASARTGSPPASLRARRPSISGRSR